MTFTLIKGVFVPDAGNPDGDSVRFRAKERKLLLTLEGRPPNISKKNQTVQLRLEGIDAIEKAAIKPLSTEAKESLLELIGYNETSNPTPSGYILARMTDDQSGRPICFVFPETTNKSDGEEVFLEGTMLRDSVNYQQILRGYAYPLYYNTLFANLRKELNQALEKARQGQLGYWPQDKTLEGVTVTSSADLATIPPIWPKLWRRLQEYFKEAESLEGFDEFLKEKNERIDILSIMEEKGFDDIVAVVGDTVKLLVSPEDIRVVGKAGRRSR